jgi:hypothetical protein
MMPRSAPFPSGRGLRTNDLRATEGRQQALAEASECEPYPMSASTGTHMLALR